MVSWLVYKNLSTKEISSGASLQSKTEEMSGLETHKWRPFRQSMHVCLQHACFSSIEHAPPSAPFPGWCQVWGLPAEGYSIGNVSR